MMSLFEVIRHFIELAPRAIITLCIVSGPLALGPSPILVHLGSDRLVTQYYPWIGGAFVLSATCLLVIALPMLYKWLKNKRSACLSKRQLATDSR